MQTISPSKQPTLIAHKIAAFCSIERLTSFKASEPCSLAERGVTIECQCLVDTHLYLVRLIARRLHRRLPKHIGLDELIAAGNLGLVHAASRFEGGQAIQFQTFAQFRIRGAMLDFLREMDWSPRSLRRKARDLEQSREALIAKGKLRPCDAEIASDMGMTLEDYNHLVQELHSLDVQSLNAPSSHDIPEEHIAYATSPVTENPLFRCLQGELKQFVVACINLLPEKERIILSFYYYEELAMKDIAATLRISESRVSQLHSSAVLRLRSLLDQHQ